MTRWIDQPDHVRWLQEQLARQLAYAELFPHPDGGSWYLGPDGRLDRSRPVHTWITSRMLHVHDTAA